MADNVIGIKFGVAGGKSLSGESGRLIKEQLESIASKISLKININRAHFTKQLAPLKKEIQKTLGDLNINVGTTKKPSGGGSSGGSTKKEIDEYAQLERQLEKLYQSKSRLLKQDGKTVTKTKLKHEVDEITKSYKEQLETLKKSTNVDQSRIKALQDYERKLRSALNAEKKAFNTPQQASATSVAKLNLKAQSLYTDNGFDKIIARSKEAKQLVDDFNAKVMALGDNATKGQVDELNKEFLNTEARLKQIGRETDTVGNKIKGAFKAHVLQALAAFILTTLVKALKQVYQNVIELDKAITNLQVATGKTRAETELLVKSYSKLAQQLGATTIEVAEAADTWLRQGYDVAETNILIADTLKLAKLGQLDSAAAAKALTSAMKGYKIAVEDATEIVDKFTAVDMEAAVSAGDIATAMAETAAGADIAGVSMNTLIGYIATVAEVTQDGAESVGTFYKTLFARMNNVKAGKFVDDETGESLNDVEKVLSKLGISLRDTNGLFRDSSAVLDEVGAKWETFDNVQQHAIATAFAGTRQQEKFIVLMENYADALEYANVAANSYGTATKKYDEAYLNSIEAKSNALKAAWQEFSQNILDSDLIKFFVDLLKVVVDIFNAITSFADGFIVKTALIGVAVYAAVSLIKKAFDGTMASLVLFGETVKGVAIKIGASLKALATNPYTYIVVLISLFVTFSDTLGEAGNYIVFAVLAIGVAVIGTLAAINTAVHSFMASNPLGWILAAITAVVIAITALVKGIINTVNRSTKEMEEAVEAAKESKEEWEEAAEQLKEVEEELDKTKDRIQELQILSNEGKITLVQQDELDKLQVAIANLEAEKALLEGIEKVKKDAAEKDAATAVDKILAEKLSDAYVQEDDTFLNGVGRVAASIFSLGISDAFGYGISDWSVKKVSAGDYVKDILGDWENATEQQRTYAIDFYNRLSEQKDMLSYHTGDNLEQWQKDANEAYNTYYEYTHRFLLANNNAAAVWESALSMERFPDIKETLSEFADAGNVTGESLKGLYNSNSSFRDLIDYMIQLGMFAWEDAEKVSGLVNQINALAKANQAAVKVGFVDILSEIEEKFDSLSEVLESIESNGVAAAGSISDLLQKFPTLAKYFKMTSQGYVKADAYKDMSTLDILQDFSTGYLQEYVDALALYEEGTENWKIAQENLNNAIAVCATLMRSQAIAEATADMEAQKEAIEGQLEQYKELIDIRKDLLKTYEEELSYQKELAQKQRSVADLQAQVAVAKLDKSAAGQARLRDLESQLSEAEEELDEFTLEHAVEQITAQLESEYSQYETFIKGEVDRLEEAIKGIAKNINVSVSVPTTSTNNEEEGNNSGNTNANTQSTTPGMPAGHSPWTSYQDAVDAGFSNIAGASASEKSRVKNWDNPHTGQKYANYQEYLDVMYMKYVGKYHTGGFVGDISTLRSNEQFAKLLKGELVSTPAQMDRFIKQTLPGMIDFAQGGDVNYNAPLISLECGSVTKEAMPELEALLNKAIEKLKSQIDSGLSRNGFKRTVNKFST